MVVGRDLAHAFSWVTECEFPHSAYPTGPHSAYPTGPHSAYPTGQCRDRPPPSSSGASLVANLIDPNPGQVREPIGPRHRISADPGDDRPSAGGWSRFPAASPDRRGDWSSTCPRTGPGRTARKGSSTRSAGHQSQQRPDPPSPNRHEDPREKAGQTGGLTTPTRSRQQLRTLHTTREYFRGGSRI